MSANPIPGASVLVCNDDKVLLIQRAKEPYKGCWSLPGGAQDFGETLAACAQRELREETGLHATELELAAVRDRINRDENGDVLHHYVLATFVVVAFSGTPAAADDAADIGWFSLPEIDALQTTPELPSFILEVLESLIED